MTWPFRSDVNGCIAAISGISSTLADVQSAANAALAALHRISNQFLPVFKLPVEILCRIFTASSALAISHTCTRWRAIALDHPSLWSSVLNLSSMSAPLARLFIERSLPLPLRIRFWGEKASSAQADFMRSVYANQTHRIEELKFTANRPDDPVPVLRGATSLRRLSASSRYPSERPLRTQQSSDAPRLQELKLSFYEIELFLGSWPTVTRLDLYSPRKDTTGCLSAVLVFVVGSPRLKYLALRYPDLNANADMDAVSGLAVTLPHLSSVCLDVPATVAKFLLRAIATPRSPLRVTLNIPTPTLHHLVVEIFVSNAEWLNRLTGTTLEIDARRARDLYIISTKAFSPAKTLHHDGAAIDVIFNSHYGLNIKPPPNIWTTKLDLYQILRVVDILSIASTLPSAVRRLALRGSAMVPEENSTVDMSLAVRSLMPRLIRLDVLAVYCRWDAGSASSSAADGSISTSERVFASTLTVMGSMQNVPCGLILEIVGGDFMATHGDDQASSNFLQDLSEPIAALAAASVKVVFRVCRFYTTEHSLERCGGSRTRDIRDALTQGGVEVAFINCDTIVTDLVPHINGSDPAIAALSERGPLLNCSGTSCACLWCTCP